MSRPRTLDVTDWSNPLVRAHLKLYPEATTKISEFLGAGKALPTVIDTTKLDLFPLMWADWEHPLWAQKQFFVREVAECRDGRYLLLMRWLVEDSKVCVDALELLYNTEVSERHL